MSLARGDLLTKTRKLVKGLAKAKPVWLKAMEEYVTESWVCILYLVSSAQVLSLMILKKNFFC